MKMKLYYIVYVDSYDGTFIYEAGPFNYTGACEYKVDFGLEYRVVEQVIEVEYV